MIIIILDWWLTIEHTDANGQRLWVCIDEAKINNIIVLACARSGPDDLVTKTITTTTTTTTTTIYYCLLLLLHCYCYYYSY
jgi:hypothetical protein